MKRINNNTIPVICKNIFIVFLFFWSIAQPLAVLDGVPTIIRHKLFFIKNLLGVILVIYGIIIILFTLKGNSHRFINKKLLLLSLPFPVVSLFNMLLRGYGTSLEEQILYFLWPIALFAVFPAFFNNSHAQRNGLLSIMYANLLVLLYSIIFYSGNININDWLNYGHRVHFSIMQPNIYSASWAVIFGCSFYLFIIGKNVIKKIVLFFICVISVIFIFLARSESVLLFCIGSATVYVFKTTRIDIKLKAATICIIIAVIATPLSGLLFDYDQLNSKVSGRIDLWSETWNFNIRDADWNDYLVGQSSFQPGSVHFTGERTGYNARRAQIDNLYFAIFLQNGVIGFILYFIPLVVMLIYLYHQSRMSSYPEYNKYIWVISLWIGVFLASWGMDVIPSFGNVFNIFLFVACAPEIIGNNRILKS